MIPSAIETRPAAALLLALHLVLCGIGDASAQLVSGEGAATEQTPSGPQPIPVSRITLEAEKVRQRLRELQGLGEADEAIERLAEELPRRLEDLRELRASALERLASQPSLRQLQELSSRWTNEKSRIEAVRAQIDRRATQLDAALEELQRRRTRWELSREAARAQEAQDAVRQAISGVLAEVQALESRIGERRSALLNWQNLVYEMDLIDDQVFEQIDVAQLEGQIRLVRPDRTPIWSEIADGVRLRDLEKSVRENLRHSAVDLKEFYARNQYRIFQQAALFVLLLVVLVSLRRRVESIEISDEAMQRLRGILDAPWATALAISLALSLLIYPKAPPAVIDLIAVVIFFPLLRVLRATIESAARFRFTLVWLLFVLDRCAVFFDAGALTPRLILLIENALGLAFLLRVRATGSEVLKGRSDLLKNIGRVILLLFIAQLMLALLTNVVGYVGLANLLTGSVVLSLYIGAVLLGLYPAVRSLVEFAPELQPFRRLRLFQRHRGLLEGRAIQVLRWAFFLIWAYSYVELLNLLPSLRLALATILDAGARFGELEVSLRDVLAFVITIFAASLISRFVRFVLEEDVYHRLALPRGVPHAISTGLHYAILLVGFILAVAATGIDLSRITLLVGAFGVGIGFGLQNVVNNFVSGIILIAERPVMPGDIIELDGLYGEVKRIGMRSSTVRTWEGAEVIVPNGELISRQVTNWTLSDRMRRVDVEVGVAYGTDLDQVSQVLQTVAEEHPEAAKYPRPTVLCLGYGDSAILYAVRVWTRFDDFVRVRSEITVAIGKALREVGITIPFPQRDLHVRSVDREALKDLQRGDGGN